MTRASAAPARVRRLLARIPSIAWLCAGVALANGLIWSWLTPPFQVPDEVAHVAYVQRIAETGRLPARMPYYPSIFSQEENELIGVLGVASVAGRPRNMALVTETQTEAVRRVERKDLSRRTDAAGNASDNRPLYYLLGAAVYWASPSGDLLDRMVLLRILSAVFAAVAAGAVVLFLREAMPRAPTAWAVGGLAAALQPTFGFLSGGVTPDPFLIMLSSLLFLAIARMFRRGLTVRLGVAIGLICAAGWMTKPIFQGLLPGAALALVAGSLRAAVPARRLPRLAELRPGLVAAACCLVPMALYALITHTVWERPFVDAGPAPAVAAPLHPGVRQEISYIWQLFLPRLPFMDDLHPGFPLREIWNAGFTGQFGLLDYGFPSWLYDATWWIECAIGALAVGTLVAWRRRLAPRVPELLVYALLVAGIALAIGVQDWRAFEIHGLRFIQGRYLLPLLPLYAAFVALPVRVLGRRWGSCAGALIVVALLGASIYAQLLTVVRYAT